MYLGIDLGTSSVKVVIVDDDLNVIAQASESLTISNPKPLWSEQNPADWWQATCTAMHTLKQNHATELAQVRAIGLSGQMHGATLLDENNNVLRPAMLWNDVRSGAECQWLETHVPGMIDITCNRVMAGFTAPKVLWVKNHEPEAFAQTAKILLPKDYLRLKISGDYATDMSDASGTSWLDVKNRCWSKEILSACDLTIDHMPKVFEGTQITGRVLPEIAQQWGIPETTVIAAGAGDNAAAAISMKVINSGDGFLSLGTSGVYFIANEQCHANPYHGVHTYAHCLPNRWHSMNCHLSAANCLTWFAEIADADIAELIEKVEQLATQEPLLFLPYLSGERSPHSNPYARGMFFGLSHSTTKTDMFKAVLEGIAFNFKQGQDAFNEVGVQAKSIYVVGGGAKSYYWGKLLAAILDQPLIYCQDCEVGAAVGAARLAYLAVNDLPAEKALADNQVATVIEPEPELVEYYKKLYPAFKSLYRNNKDLFQQLYATEE